MLTGVWKNFEELEDSINLAELAAIIEAVHKKEHRFNRMVAAMNGHQLDEPENTETNEERVNRLKARADAINAGMSEEAAELDYFGIEVETE